MNKLFKLATVSFLTVTMGVAAVPSNVMTASAKARSAKVLKMSKMKKTAYDINGGYIYSSTKLTKKSHNGKKYLKTRFYATKSASLKKTNGKKGTYYYIKNTKGNVKGWTAKGNLTKINTKAEKRRASDVKKMWAAVRTMGEGKDEAMGDLSKINGDNDLDTYSYIGETILDMCPMNADIQDNHALLQAYNIFKSRFSKSTNNKLAILASRLKSVQNSKDDSWNANYNLESALRRAVENLY